MKEKSDKMSGISGLQKPANAKIPLLGDQQEDFLPDGIRPLANVTLTVTSRCGTAGANSRIKIKIKVKGDGQECPSHMIRSTRIA
jgi:hypothetical protein